MMDNNNSSLKQECRPAKKKSMRGVTFLSEIIRKAVSTFEIGVARVCVVPIDYIDVTIGKKW